MASSASRTRKSSFARLRICLYLPVLIILKLHRTQLVAELILLGLSKVFHRSNNLGDRAHRPRVSLLKQSSKIGGE